MTGSFPHLSWLLSPVADGGRVGRLLRGVVAWAVGCGTLVVEVPSASATGRVTSTVSPTAVTVGQASVSGSILLTNSSTAPESAGGVTISTITMVPSCDVTTATALGDCPLASADTGVFQITGSGTGAAGTACAGTTFVVTTLDAQTGELLFAPGSATVVLAAPAMPDSTCEIDFTFNVLKAPAHPAAPSPPNTVATAAIINVGGTATGDLAPVDISSPTLVTVAKAQPSVTTATPPTASVGASIGDTATLAAAVPPGPSPTGTITFRLFGPGDPACSGTPAFTSTVPVDMGTGSYGSARFSPTTPGNYRWVAAYSGDANDISATTACGDANESVTVTKATPIITTHASATVTVGGTISDTATLAGGAAPTGNVLFSAYGPNDTSCSGPVVFTSTGSVAGNGAYTSGSFDTTTAGTYQFVALYGGDADNNAATTACGDANETATVAKAVPAISTHASATVTVIGTISDTATLAAGDIPTGTIVFDGYGPGNATCTGTPTFTSTVPAGGDGTYASAGFAATAAGTYQFVAAYSGDSNNLAETTACGDANESVTVTKATPSITTLASDTVTVGGTISDTATLGGGDNPTGTIVFGVYGPGNGTCSGAPAFTSTSFVNAGNAVYPPPPSPPPPPAPTSSSPPTAGTPTTRPRPPRAATPTRASRSPKPHPPSPPTPRPP